MSQLLERLKRDFNCQADPIERAEILARIACTLARLGRFGDARESISALRREFGAGQSGRVTTWILLAEGLVLHYEDLSPVALDRITRAQLLAEAMRYPAVVALASAWKAHIEFETSKFPSMIRSLTIASANVDESDHDAQTRLAMVLSNAFMISGDREQSERWFQRGRKHAVINGDQASIEALLYNRVAFVLAWFRVANCMGAVGVEEIRRIRFEIASAKNLQDLTQISALASHVRLLDARLMIVEERYRDAIEALQAVRHEAPFARHNFDQSFIDLEIAFCSQLGGEVGSESAWRSGIESDALERLDIDEQIVAAWMVWRMADSKVDSEHATRARHRLDELLADYRSERARLRADLCPFELA